LIFFLASVGLGSDFDGMEETPEGLEDVSKYPALVCTHLPLPSSHTLIRGLCHKIAELYRRGWDRDDLAGLTGGNLLRVMESAEEVARKLQLAGTLPVYDLYKKRKDIPRPQEEL